MKRTLSSEEIHMFGEHLRHEERSSGTIEKYLRDVHAFVIWLGGDEVTKETVIKWRDSLLDRGYAPVTVNSMLAAVNSIFHYLDWKECCVKALKIQRRVFRDQNRELTRGEYVQLINTAHRIGNLRLELLMETICATGIRVSEVQYITVEAAHQRRAEISLKGKIRTILIPGKLAKKLLKYAQKQKITFGEIFLTKSGKSLSRRQIWAEMKGICQKAGVEETKVFPHNLRHLFARTFYQVCRDIAKLADVLGHSSIETTRIYLISTGKEHASQLDRLGLVS